MRESAHIARDPDAFAAFYRRHVDAVTRFLTRRVDSPHLAADLTAEVFLAVLESADTYQPGRGPEIAWLYGIARNVMAGERRRAARASRASRRFDGRRLLDSDDIARMEERIDASAWARSAREAMSALPPKQCAVLELVAVDGLTLAEAAAALGISRVAARVRLHRARNVLQTELPSPSTPIHAEAEA